MIRAQVRLSHAVYFVPFPPIICIVSKEFKNVDAVGPYYCSEQNKYNNIIGEW